MTDPQDALIDAVNTTLDEYIDSGVRGPWVLVYEVQDIKDGDTVHAVGAVGDGSPLARLGLLTAEQHRLREFINEGAEEP